MSDQDRWEVEVRGWLASVAAPPTRLELDSIRQLGRSRIRRRRRLALGGSAAVVLAIVAAVPLSGQLLEAPDQAGSSPLAWPVVECVPAMLPLPAEVPGPERQVQIFDMDPTGRYVLGVARPLESVDPFTIVLWEDGQPTVVSPPDDARRPIPVAVSAGGVVVGFATPGRHSRVEGRVEGRVAWTYRNGEVTLLAAPHPIAAITGINAAGDVAGWLTDGGQDILAVWPEGRPEQPWLAGPDQLGLPDGASVDSVVIGDDGTLVGTFYPDAGEPDRIHAFSWHPDRGTSLLPEPSRVQRIAVQAVTGEWAVGTATRSVATGSLEPLPSGSPPGLGIPTLEDHPSDEAEFEVSVPVRWHLRAGTVEIVTYADLSRHGISSHQTAVSATGEVTATVDAEGGLVVRDGRWQVLPPPAATVWPTVAVVSDDGATVAGWVADDGGDRESGSFLPEWPVMWRC
jgi:hypothetical protein